MRSPSRSSRYTGLRPVVLPDALWVDIAPLIPPDAPCAKGGRRQVVAFGERFSAAQTRPNFPADEEYQTRPARPSISSPPPIAEAR